jgi:hypothetical protein
MTLRPWHFNFTRGRGQEPEFGVDLSLKGVERLIHAKARAASCSTLATTRAFASTQACRVLHAMQAVAHQATTISRKLGSDRVDDLVIGAKATSLFWWARGNNTFPQKI